MQIVPGELRVFGTSGDYVIFDLGATKPHVLLSEVPDGRDLKPGDTVSGVLYTHRDGTSHLEPEG